MVAAWLEYIVESQSLFSSSQCGFRRDMGTMDILLRLEHLIRSSQTASEICLVVYIDLQSAFDKVCINSLIFKLRSVGLTGNMVTWLMVYLKSWSIWVRVRGVLSDPQVLGAGVPQGAVLSPLLFNLFLMDISLQDSIQTLIYADDITIACQAENIRAAKLKMINYLNILWDYFKRWGLVVNPNKSLPILFQQKAIRFQLCIMKGKLSIMEHNTECLA
jgi:hypothetical protein